MINRLRKTSFLYFYFFIIFIFNIGFYLYINKLYLQPIFGLLLPLFFISLLLKVEEKVFGFKKNSKNNDSEFEERRFFKKEQRTYSSYDEYKKAFLEKEMKYDEFQGMLTFFNIDENFNLKELKKAYKEKMKQVHPDNNHSITAHSESIKANDYFNKLKISLGGKR